MTKIDQLTVDYHDYTPPEDLPKGRLIEAERVQMHIVGDGEKTVVVPRAFDAYSGDPFEQLRDRMLAHALDARVIGIDIPGVGLNRSSQSTPQQRKEAMNGSLASRSKIMIEALDQFGSKELNFIGYSMGAWAVAAMVQSPTFRERKLRVGAISLVEPVNDQDWQMRTVHKILLGEFGHEKRYKRETEAHFPTLPTPVLPENGLPMKSKPAMPSLESLRLIKGMGIGFAPALAEAVQEDSGDHATGLSEAPFTIYRANGSFATRREAAEATFEALLGSGQRNLRFSEFAPRQDKDNASDPQHHHLFWHSMGAVAMLGTHMRNQGL